MESEANNFPVIPRQVELLREVPRLHEDILRHMATFLDFQSIRQFRLVCGEWNAAGIAILMKRGSYNLTHPCHENEHPDLYRGANNYSSWKISHSVYESAELLHDNEIWRNIRSLTIRQLIPLTREFDSWAWETIETRCPNLKELTVIFEPISDSQPESKVYKDHKRAISEKPNASFPKIANLRNVTSVTFEGIYDKTTAYFAQNLLQACTTNLRHLYFCPIGQPRNNKLEVEAFRIFKYLKQNPRLLRNLQSFGFNIGFYSAHEDDEDPWKIFCEQLKFTKFMQRTDDLSIQFNSDKLTMLSWDSPFYRGDQLLPGVLTPSIASSLVQLCLNGNVMKLHERAEITYDLVKISFPNFTRLRALKLSFSVCRSLSVPKLVDSAPNLFVLEMQRMGLGDWNIRNDMSSVWLANEDESVSNPQQPHLQLRIFCTDIPFDGSSTLEVVSSKFPNLEELRLGWVKKVDPDPFLSIVKSYHSKLQRLSWTLVEKEEIFTLDELFLHLLRVPELLPTLNVYSLGHEQGLFYNGYLKIQDQDVKNSADILLRLLSNSNNNSCLRCIHLLMICLTCDCDLTEEEESAQNDCKACYLHQFIRRHNLPIRIHSGREIEEMKVKYRWDHRFGSCWIYK